MNNNNTLNVTDNNNIPEPSRFVKRTQRYCKHNPPECYNCCFRHPAVEMKLSTCCKYYENRDQESFQCDRFENIRILFGHIYDDPKFDETNVEDLYNEVEEHFLEIEELQEIRMDGFEADDVIDRIMVKAGPLLDKLEDLLPNIDI